jgi:hypothetical protein
VIACSTGVRGHHPSIHTPVAHSLLLLAPPPCLAHPSHSPPLPPTSQGHPCSSSNNDARDAIGSEPAWLDQSLREIGFEGSGTTAQSVYAQSEYTQLQAMAQQACATEVSRAVSAKQVASCAAAAAASTAASAAASHFDAPYGASHSHSQHVDAQYGASMLTTPTPEFGDDAFGSAPLTTALNGLSSGSSSSSSWNVPSTGGGGGGGLPRLLDASCREGSFGGGHTS